MKWQEHLRQLERSKQWDEAISFMEDIIKKNSNDMDAYIAMNYLLMNLLVEEDHDETKHDHYEMLTKKYFDESWPKFSENPEYLYYTGMTAAMSYWYFGVGEGDSELMTDKALRLDPDNLVFQWNYYWDLSRKNISDNDVLKYIEKVRNENSSIQKTLRAKGAIGECILAMVLFWSQNVIDKSSHL